MRCANCQQEIEIGTYQCPFCRHNPLYPAWADKGTKEDQVRTPGEGAAAVAVLVTGLLLTSALPYVGVPLLMLGGIGVVNSVVQFFRNNRR